MAVQVLPCGQSLCTSQATYSVSVKEPASTVPVHLAVDTQVVEVKPFVFW